MDGTIRVYDTVTSKQLKVLTVGCPVSSIAFSKNSAYILSCSADSIGRLWDWASGTVKVEYRGAVQATGGTALAFSESEDLVIGPDESSFGIAIWDAVNGTLLKKMAGHAGKIRALAVAPTRDVFVTCSEDSKAKLWESLLPL
jgi:WD40 repeat protein